MARKKNARGLYVGTVELGEDENGKRLRQWVYGKTEKAMLAKKRKAEAARDAGLPAVSQVLTMRAWLEHWVENIAPLTAKRSHHIYAQVLTMWVYPHIKRTPLVKWQTDDYYRLMRTLEKQGLSEGSRAKVRAVLHRAFNVAVQEGKLQRNVVAIADGVKMPYKTSDAMDAAQVSQLLAYLEAEHDRLYALAVLVLMCGLRKSEALDMRWSDLDLDAATLNIPRSKTTAGERKIPLPSPVVTALRKHRDVQELDILVADVWGDPDLVFTTTIGTRIHPRNCLRWWHEVTIASGVGRRRFHAARHTAATVLKSKGVETAMISRILGHSRTAVTEAIYIKADVEMLRPAMDVLDRLYGDA